MAIFLVRASEDPRFNRFDVKLALSVEKQGIETRGKGKRHIRRSRAHRKAQGT